MVWGRHRAGMLIYLAALKGIPEDCLQAAPTWMGRTCSPSFLVVVFPDSSSGMIRRNGRGRSPPPILHQEGQGS